MRYILAVFILFCAVSLVKADTIISYEYLSGNTSVNVTTTTTDVETWTLEDVLFKKRSWEADAASRAAGKESYLTTYNETETTKAKELVDLNAILANMTVPK